MALPQHPENDNPFSKLGLQVINEIALHLGPETLNHLGQTCKYINKIFSRRNPNSPFYLNPKVLAGTASSSEYSEVADKIIKLLIVNNFSAVRILIRELTRNAAFKTALIEEINSKATEIKKHGIEALEKKVCSLEEKVTKAEDIKALTQEINGLEKELKAIVSAFYIQIEEAKSKYEELERWLELPKEKEKESEVERLKTRYSLLKSCVSNFKEKIIQNKNYKDHYNQLDKLMILALYCCDVDRLKAVDIDDNSETLEVFRKRVADNYQGEKVFLESLELCILGKIPKSKELLIARLKEKRHTSCYVDLRDID
jgi:hypothetical protein